MNCVVLVGRITRDPELKTTNSNISVVSFTVAVNKRFKPQNGGPDADFIDCVAFRQSAEFINNYVRKGNLLSIKGSLSVRNYTAQDGSSRKTTEVIVDEVSNLTPKSSQNTEPRNIPAPSPYDDNMPQPNSDYAPYANENNKIKDTNYDPFSDE